MTYTKEQVFAIELKKAKEIARDYIQAEHNYWKSRDRVSEKESYILLEDAFMYARVMVAHILNLNNIDDTVKFYNTPNTFTRR